MEKEIKEYLQRMWNMVVRAEGHEEREQRRIEAFCSCALMANALTGKQFDVNSDDVVYIVGEEEV